MIESPQFSRRNAASAASATALLLAGFAAPIDFLEPAAQRALGMTLFALIMWMAQPVAIELSSLVVLILIPATGMLSFETTFLPFANATVWLVFAGMVLSHALSSSGLDNVLAVRLLKLLGGGRLRPLVAMHALGLAAAVLVPSGVVRVLLLLPIGIALIDRCRDKGNPLLNATLLLSLLCSTYYGGCGILTGGVPNLVVAAQLEQVTGRVVFWGEWLTWMFPVVGVGRTALSLFVMWSLFGRRLQEADWRVDERLEKTELLPQQRRVLGILLLGVALWATDTWHHMPPVYIGLGLAVLCVLPSWGTLRFEQVREVNFPFFFYLVALFGIGSVLQESGFSSHAMAGLLSHLDMQGYSAPMQHLAIAAVVLPLNFLMDIAAVGAVVTPTMITYGEANGLSALSSAMSVAMATTTVFLPYQSAPFMVALGFRRFSMAQLVTCMMLISVLSVLLLWPLNVLYWSWTGLI